MHVVKDKDDANAIGTLDLAIGVRKRMIKRTTEAKSGNWLSHLAAAIDAYHNSNHGGIDDEPANLSDDKIFSLKREAAEDSQENTEIIKTMARKVD